jgi:hypothetical protein
MHWVNWLLEKCVVEKEDQMQIHDGQELGAEMDLALDALRRNCVTPTRAREPHRRCRVCGVGQYNRVVKSGTDESIVKQYLIFQCDQCQHIDYFWREPI